MSEHNAGSMMGGFLLGAVVGAGVALIFAPMAGKDTRRHIGEAARKLKDGSRDKVNHLVGALKEGAEDLGAALHAGKEAFSHGASQASHERGVNATVEGRTS